MTLIVVLKSGHCFEIPKADWAAFFEMYRKVAESHQDTLMLTHPNFPMILTLTEVAAVYPKP